jgi:MiaB-like tRNA modifying enzyme
MKIFIKTYGCQANINDSEILAGKLKSKGNELVKSEEEADKIIVNTCSVKNKTQSKILHYLKQYQDKEVEVSGCLTNTIDLQEKFPKVKTIDTINTNKLNNPLVLSDSRKAIIQISQGCLNNCTFCATKLSRGTLKSYRIGDIKRQLESAVNDGATKIHLTSQDNGCYGFDINTNLPELLNELTTINGNFIIRVGMMNPWHLNKIQTQTQLIKSMKSPNVTKFIHLPIQSGSEKVLKDMKRIHTTKEFKDFAKQFRKTFPRANFPDSTIATDIIVGYPTETEEDFQQTLNLIKEVKPEVLNISTFSSRPKTEASKLKQLDSKIIKQRTKKLNDLYLGYRNALIN